MQNLNRVVLTGNLTKDPELKDTQGGTKVCQIRLAVNGRIKQDGAWHDKPNYFDVVSFGATAENAAKYLAKGRAMAVDGRLDWREWSAQDGSKRQAVQVIADTIQFLSDGKSENGGSEEPQAAAQAAPAEEDIPF